MQLSKTSLNWSTKLSVFIKNNVFFFMFSGDLSFGKHFHSVFFYPAMHYWTCLFQWVTGRYCFSGLHNVMFQWVTERYVSVGYRTLCFNGLHNVIVSVGYRTLFFQWVTERYCFSGLQNVILSVGFRTLGFSELHNVTVSVGYRTSVSRARRIIGWTSLPAHPSTISRSRETSSILW